jgi:YbbR domain-containing protein
MERIGSWLSDVVGIVTLVVREVFGSLRENWGIGILSLGLAIALWVFVTDRENPDVTGRVPGSIPIETVNVPPDRAIFALSQTAVTVRVRAPESVFEDLTADDFRAVVDLSSVTSLQETLEVRVEPDEARVDVLEVTPAEIEVQLEDVTSVAVPVRAAIVGTPPRGFEIGETVVEPAEAVVTGPASLVDRVEAVEADANLTGAPTTFEQTLLLTARDARGANIEGVSIEPERATVRVEIVQLEFTAAFVVVPDVEGTPADGFRVTGLAVEPSIVIVSGPAEVFQTLDPLQGISTAPVVIDGASADVVRPVALQLPPEARVEQETVTVRITIEAVLSEP